MVHVEDNTIQVGNIMSKSGNVQKEISYLFCSHLLPPVSEDTSQ